MKQFIISEQEKKRIIKMHEKASLKNYLFENPTTPTLPTFPDMELTDLQSVCLNSYFYDTKKGYFVFNVETKKMSFNQIDTSNQYTIDGIKPYGGDGCAFDYNSKINGLSKNTKLIFGTFDINFDLKNAKFIATKTKTK